MMDVGGHTHTNKLSSLGLEEPQLGSPPLIFCRLEVANRYVFAGERVGQSKRCWCL